MEWGHTVTKRIWPSGSHSCHVQWCIYLVKLLRDDQWEQLTWSPGAGQQKTSLISNYSIQQKWVYPCAISFKCQMIPKSYFNSCIISKLKSKYFIWTIKSNHFSKNYTENTGIKVESCHLWSLKLYWVHRWFPICRNAWTWLWNDLCPGFSQFVTHGAVSICIEAPRGQEWPEVLKIQED